MKHNQPLRSADKPMWQNAKRSIRIAISETYDRQRVAETTVEQKTGKKK